jgi:hypothetical protein
MVIGSDPAAAHARQLKEDWPQLLAAKCIVRPRCVMTIATLRDVFLKVAVGSAERHGRATRSVPGRCVYFGARGQLPDRDTVIH